MGYFMQGCRALELTFRVLEILGFDCTWCEPTRSGKAIPSCGIRPKAARPAPCLCWVRGICFWVHVFRIQCSSSSSSSSSSRTSFSQPKALQQAEPRALLSYYSPRLTTRNPNFRKWTGSPRCRWSSGGQEAMEFHLVREGFFLAFMGVLMKDIYCKHISVFMIRDNNRLLQELPAWCLGNEELYKTLHRGWGACVRLVSSFRSKLQGFGLGRGLRFLFAANLKAPRRILILIMGRRSQLAFG